MPNTFFIADTHFWHTNIIKYCQRPFNSADEMNSFMIKNWNEKVQPYDHVWHLGDVAFIHNENRGKFLSLFHSLNGIKHLVTGNHDSKEVMEAPWASLQEYKELKINKQKLVLFHYPIYSWNAKFHGAVHLYGHTHSTVHLGAGALDVGVDSIGYAPISLDDAVTMAKGAKQHFAEYKSNHQPPAGP